jgi:hypothetical protein
MRLQRYGALLALSVVVDRNTGLRLPQLEGTRKTFSCLQIEELGKSVFPHVTFRVLLVLDYGM